MLNESLILALFFGAGIVIRSFFGIRSWKDLALWTTAWFIATILIERLQWNEGRPIPLDYYLFVLFLFFAFFATLFLFKNFLSSASEKSILILTLLFLYCFIKYALPLHEGAFYVLLISLIPALLTICVSFVNMTLNRFGKIFFYLWFIILNISFLVFYFFSNEMSLKTYASLQFISPYDAFITGITLFSLMANFGYIYMLFAFQTSRRMVQQEDFSDFVVSKHDDGQLKMYQSILILLFIGGGLTANYFFNFVADSILVPTCLFVSQIMMPAVLPSKTNTVPQH